MKVEEIRQISVIGAGLMGHGIAQEFAVGGYDVHLYDVDDGKLRQAREGITNNLKMLAGIGLVNSADIATAGTHLTYGTTLREAAIKADIVIEAVFEDLKLKQDLFRSLDEISPPHAILTSNTSSLLPSKLASTTRRPDKVLVTHYFNPPYLLPLVEIVRHEKVSDETVETIHALLTKVGKTPVVVQKEIPGFIGNRLQTALFREALSIVQQGIATAQDVDTVIKNSFGRRLAAAGVFEIWEIAGWDLVSAICQNLYPDLDASTEVPRLLREKVERGELGVKSGKGFYDWTPESSLALKQRIAWILSKVAQGHRGE